MFDRNYSRHKSLTIGFITKASVSALLLILAACARSPEAESSLTYGLTLAPTGIDPHINASVELGIPLSSVYDTLVFQDPVSGEFVPGLAENWSVSEDGLTYTFDLRRDVVFHDGQPFNGEAVRANIDYVTNPDHRSQKAAAMLGPLGSVEVLDEYRVAFHLESPFAPLLDSLSQVYLGMASPEALERWGPGDYQFNQVGTGPYRFIDYVPNDHLTLERNTEYAWAPSIYQNQSAQIDRITFRFYEDPATRALALESGQVDIIGELPHHEAQRLGQSPDYSIHTLPIPGQPLQLIFNTTVPPTQEVEIREALTLGVDRAAVVERVFGNYSPTASGPLANGTLGYSEQAAFPGYDPARAAELLDRAGWLRGPNGLRQNAGEDLQLMVVVPSWGSNPEVGQLIAADWEALGAEVTLEIAAGFGPLIDARAEGNYHAIGMNSFGSDPDLLRPFYDSNGFFNWGGYQDPELDSLLEQGAAAFDSEILRDELYAEFAEQVRDHWLILPVRDYVNLVGTGANVAGLRFSPQGWFPYLIDLELRP